MQADVRFCWSTADSIFVGGMSYLDANTSSVSIVGPRWGGQIPLILTVEATLILTDVGVRNRLDDP